MVISVEEAPVTPTSKEIPHLIRFQGRLTDKSNMPLNGYYNITFGLYNDEAGGDLLWDELHDNLQVADGIVNVLLGKINPLDLPFDTKYWLSVEVNGETMSPRQPITSTAYSYTAEFAKSGGKATYTNQDEISDTLSSRLYMHLDGAPSSVKLYIWGEAGSDGYYPDGLTVEINDIDVTSSILSLANANWDPDEPTLGDGTSSHPLMDGTGELDITSLVTWSKGEHVIEVKQSASTKAKVIYNVYISY